MSALALSGCKSETTKTTESSGNLKQLAIAVLHSHTKNGAYPDRLEDIKPLIGTDSPFGVIGGGKDYATLMKNPLTGDDPGYEYVKPGPTGDGAMLYQLRDGKRDTTLPIGYVDGSVR